MTVGRRYWDRDLDVDLLYKGIVCSFDRVGKYTGIQRPPSAGRGIQEGDERLLVCDDGIRMVDEH